MLKFSGIVQKGSKQAERHGFPTANIPLPDTAASGVYAAHVTVGGKTYRAAAFADQKRHVLEAHLFDFSDDLYGGEIIVELLSKTRERKEFADEKEMKETIGKDMIAVRQYFDHAN